MHFRDFWYIDQGISLMQVSVRNAGDQKFEGMAIEFMLDAALMGTLSIFCSVDGQYLPTYFAYFQGKRQSRCLPTMTKT